MTAHELLAYLAPPLELIEHLERYEAQGKLPAPVVAYLERWQGIRSTGATAIDGAPVHAWIEVEKKVRVNL